MDTVQQKSTDSRIVCAPLALTANSYGEGLYCRVAELTLRLESAADTVQKKTTDSRIASADKVAHIFSKTFTVLAREKGGVCSIGIGHLEMASALGENSFLSDLSAFLSVAPSN